MCDTTPYECDCDHGHGPVCKNRIKLSGVVKTEAGSTGPHLQVVVLKPGERVVKGQCIGTTSDNGPPRCAIG